MLDLIFKKPLLFRVGPFWLSTRHIDLLVAGKPLIVTNWRTEHRGPDGALKGMYDFGPGLLTADAVNQWVAQAVAGTAVVPALAATKYNAFGIAATPAYTDGDTNVTTEGTQARAVMTLTNGQTATTTNHATILKYTTGVVTLTAAATYTEYAVVDTPSGAPAHCLDHKALNPIVTGAVGDTVNNFYQIQFFSNV